MGLISAIRGWWQKMFKNDAKKAFGVEIINSQDMDLHTTKWINTYTGHPEWVDNSERIKTINFAKSVSAETARLATLALDINLDGGPRADYLKEHIDRVLMPRLCNWVEYGCATGTVIFKPNGKGADLVTPGNFWITNRDGTTVSGIIFKDDYQEGDTYYTKLEYHRYLNAEVKMPGEEYGKTVTYYMISNRTYKSNNAQSIGRECDITKTKWSNLLPEVSITKQNGEKIDSMLFGVFRMPEANNIDFDSPYGMAVFADAMEEMKDLDIAYSRNVGEIYDSETIELLDDRLLAKAGNKVGTVNVKLPHHVHNVYGNSAEEFYQSIERPLNTDKRILGINNILSIIGYKCGYSNGYFVFDEKTGMVTATQVESEDQRTIQFIKSVRDCLQVAVEEYLYAVSVFADLYDLAPVGEYETNYSFGDITYNYEEDKIHHYNLAMAGKYPWEEYYVKFLKYSREEAKKLLKMAKNENREKGLLEDEE